MAEIKFPGSWTMGMRVYLTVGGGMWKSKNADYEGEIKCELELQAESSEWV